MALKKRNRAKPRNRRRKAVMATAELKSWEPPTIQSLLDVGTQARLEAFVQAHHGANPRVVIHKAVEDFMVHDLQENANVAQDCSWKVDKTS